MTITERKVALELAVADARALYQRALASLQQAASQLIAVEAQLALLIEIEADAHG